MRILVVEDEFLIALDIKAQLETAGHDVVGPAASIEQAQSLLDAHPADIAVLDMNLRGIDSFPIAARLAAAGTPFLFLSGNDFTKLPDAFEGSLLLSKPIDFKRLLEAIAALGPA